MSDVVNNANSEVEEKSYKELHRPASEFESRSDYLRSRTSNHEASPLRFKPSRP